MNKKYDKKEVFQYLDQGMSNGEIKELTGMSQAMLSIYKKEWKNGTSCTVKKEEGSSVKHTFGFEFVGLTIYGGYEVYRIVGDQVYGFEDVFIVKCPGTIEKYDKNIFGDITWTFNMLLELGGI